MAGFVNFVRNQYADLPIPQPPGNIAEKTYIVTGANSGLGFECVKHLFSMGAGRVILAVRSQEKGEAALKLARGSISSGPSIGEVWELDLTSFDSVEAFCRRVHALDRVDAVIANAGLVATKFRAVNGIEESLFVNDVSTMLLVLRIFPKLRELARELGTQPNIVIVSSRAALDTKMKRALEALQGNIFEELSKSKSFAPLVQYPLTKLLEIYAVRQLAALVPVSRSGVIVNAVSPGLCYSALDRNAPPIPKLGLAVMRRLFARTAEQGSRNIIQAAFAGAESHGSYCSECQVKDHDLPTWITDDAGQRMQKRIWEDLLKIMGDKGHNINVEAIGPDNEGKAK